MGVHGDEGGSASARLAARDIDAICQVGNALEIDPAGYNAVIGRLILMHLQDPSALLSRLRERCRPGTLMAFMEMDVASATTEPRLAFLEDVIQAIVATYLRLGAEAEMASKLHRAFIDAGFPATSIAVRDSLPGSDVDMINAIAGIFASLPMRGDQGDFSFRSTLQDQFNVLPVTFAGPTFRCTWALAGHEPQRIKT